MNNDFVTTFCLFQTILFDEHGFQLVSLFLRRHDEREDRVENVAIGFVISILTRRIVVLAEFRWWPASIQPGGTSSSPLS